MQIFNRKAIPKKKKKLKIYLHANIVIFTIHRILKW